MNGALLNSSRQDPGDARAWPEPSAPALVCCGTKGPCISNSHSLTAEGGTVSREEPERSLPGSLLSASGHHWGTRSHPHCSHPGHGITPHSTRNQPATPPNIGDASPASLEFKEMLFSLCLIFETVKTLPTGEMQQTAKMYKRCYDQLIWHQTF